MQDQRALNRVVQLTHIARPRVTDQARLRLGRQSRRGMLHFIDVLGQQPLGQRQDIGGALAQRTPRQWKHRQAIVKVFTETPRRHFPGQVTVGGRDHADVQGDRLARADAFDFTLLQHAQQFGLQAKGHFRNFVEQDGPAIGLFELAGLRGNGAGERAFFVAEQCGFEHVVGDRRAVDRNERLTGAMGMLMDVARQHFLARPGLARDQYRGITASYPRSQVKQLRTGRLQSHRPFTVGAAETAQRMPGDQIEQGLGFERLDQIICRALTHRIHCALHGTVRRHQQHRQLRLSRPQQAQQLMTIHARHVDVAEHQVERLGLDCGQGFFRRTDGCVFVTGEQQRIGQCFA
ncbi:hypothetical protein D3C87_1186050 [compost metagenome]